MIMFISQLRHPATVVSMERTEYLLRLTVGSLQNQTSPNWRLVVVCNEVPEQRVEDQRITYHVVRFPPAERGRAPSETGTPRTIRIDKGAKTLSGMLLSREFQPRYVMPIDYDDWIHRDLVRVLLRSESWPLCYVDRGYIVNFSSRTFASRYGLVRYCGSTYAYEPKFFESLGTGINGVSHLSRLDEIRSRVDEGVLVDIAGDHHAGFRAAQVRGIKPRPIPLPALCWVVANGTNVSGETSRERGVPIDLRFCTTFGVPETLAAATSARPEHHVYDWFAALKSRATWAQSRRTGMWRF